MNYSQKDVALTDCKDGSYCCGSDNNTCCSRGQGERIRAGTTLSSTITNPSTTSLSNSTRTSNNNKQSFSLDQKAIISIAVGCGIVASVIAASADWFIFRKKRAKRPTTAFKYMEPAEERNSFYEVNPQLSTFAPLTAELSD